MARQRFIWPDLWTDPTIGRLEPLERLLFIGLFSNADDDGRILGDPAILRSTIFPYDDLTNTQVREIRDSLVQKTPSITLYKVAECEYIALRKWGDYQRPKYPKPSKLPAPPGRKPSSQAGSGSPKDGGNMGENSSSDGEELGNHSPKPSAKKVPGQGRDGLGKSSTGTKPSEGLREGPATDTNGNLDNELHAFRLASILTDKDEGTMTVLRALARDLPQAAFETVYEKVRDSAPKSPSAYAVAELKRMKQEGQYA